MDPLLLVLAPVLLLLVVGVIVGLFVARTARRDAEETRRRLEAVSARRAAAAPAPPAVPGVHDDVHTLRVLLEQQQRRLAGLERRVGGLGGEVRELAEAPDPPPSDPLPPDPPPPDPLRPDLGPGAPEIPGAEIVRNHVAALGYDEVVVLEDSAAPDAFTVEARRRGLVFKGRVHLRPGKRVEADLRPAVRAFP